MRTVGIALAQEIARHSQALEGLRDEIRLKIHLANTDAKAAWRELEPQVLEAEAFTRGVATEAGREALTDLIKRLLALRAKLTDIGTAAARG